ncbi:MAG TPA: ATP-binding protein [Nocardioidaceae bacterium]|nr:ATP-binding protein [Nocardioidaceae bacterium]
MSTTGTRSRTQLSAETSERLPNSTSEAADRGKGSTARARSARRGSRWRVRAACVDLDEPDKATVELLTSELVTNAVLHPRRTHDAPDVGVGVRIQRAPGLVGVGVHDHDHHGVGMPPARRGALDQGGRGLRLVSDLSSACGTYRLPSGGKAVWFEVDRRRSRVERTVQSSVGRPEPPRTSLAHRTLSWLLGHRARLAELLTLVDRS